MSQANWVFSFLCVQQLITNTNYFQMMQELSSTNNTQFQTQFLITPSSLTTTSEIDFINQFLAFIPENQYSSELKNPESNQSEEKKTFLKIARIIGKKNSKKSKKKKNQRREISKFHNCQKHLNNALREIIKCDDYIYSSLSHQKSASLIWNTYKQGEDESKKILHYMFNAEHTKLLDEEELRQFKMLDILNCCGSESFLKGIDEIRRWVAVQMTQNAIEHYINSRRIKNKSIFQEYLINFTKEVSMGGMKRRYKPLQQ